MFITFFKLTSKDLLKLVLDTIIDDNLVIFVNSKLQMITIVYEEMVDIYPKYRQSLFLLVRKLR